MSARMYTFPMPFLLDGLPELLKTLRERCGFAQDEVARALGFGASSMSNYENGKAISLDKLTRLLEHYGVNDFAELQQELENLSKHPARKNEPAPPPRAKTAEDMIANPPDWARFVLDQVAMRNKLDEYAEEIRRLRDEASKRGRPGGD